MESLPARASPGEGVTRGQPGRFRPKKGLKFWDAVWYFPWAVKPPIPAIWRIDVEPDEFQPAVGAKPWLGLEATCELVDRLRVSLRQRSGQPVHPTWLLRLDPDVGRCFGRTDFVVHEHRARFDEIRAHGDPLGLHVHPYRWDAERQTAYSDHADHAWTRHCLEVSARTFEQCFGEAPRRLSFGGYFLGEAEADAAIELGFEVELTAEPGLAPKAEDASLGTYSTAPTADFRTWPRQPYFPSRESLGVPAVSRAASRRLLLVPLTSYDYQTALTPWYRRWAKIALGRPRTHLPLNPWKWWPSPKAYWDLVERAADEQPARYFSFAMRTETPGTTTDQRVRGLLEYLPQHPIAERIRFVDPLAPAITSLAVPLA